MIPTADVGPKPNPTPRPPNPKPSGPSRGHLPIEADLPDLGDLLDGAERLGTQLIGLLRRGYDPATGPSDDGSVVPGHVGVRLICAAADVRSALAMLQQIRAAFPAPSTSGPHLRDIPARHHQRPTPQAVRPRLQGVQPDPTGGRESETRQGAEGRGGSPAGRPEEAPLTTSMGWGEGLQPGLAVAVSAARESDRGFPGPGPQANTNPPLAAGERADTPARTIVTPVAAMVEAPGSTAVVPGAGVQLLTPANVAELFGVDQRTVTRWAHAGRLNCVRIACGHRLYREADVRSLLAADRVVKTGASP